MSQVLTHYTVDAKYTVLIDRIIVVILFIILIIVTIQIAVDCLANSVWDLNKLNIIVHIFCKYVTYVWFYARISQTTTEKTQKLMK